MKLELKIKFKALEQMMFQGFCAIVYLKALL